MTEEEKKWAEELLDQCSLAWKDVSTYIYTLYTVCCFLPVMSKWKHYNSVGLAVIRLDCLSCCPRVNLCSLQPSLCIACDNLFNCLAHWLEDGHHQHWGCNHRNAEEDVCESLQYHICCGGDQIWENKMSCRQRIGKQSNKVNEQQQNSKSYHCSLHSQFYDNCVILNVKNNAYHHDNSACCKGELLGSRHWESLLHRTQGQWQQR